MKGTKIFNKRFEQPLVEPLIGKYVSYSQFTMWAECPHRWRLSYIDKIKEKDFSIHSLFGEVIHNIVQNWLVTLYTVSVKESNAINFKSEITSQMRSLYLKIKDEDNDGEHWLEKEQLLEFSADGLAILDFLKNKRLGYFDRKNEELVAIELPIYVQLRPNGPIFTAFIDVLIFDKRTGRWKIIDLKTSGKGWNEWDKRNEKKISQVLLYKVFLSRQYGIPIDEIDVEYYIFRRKIDTSSEFPMKRVQTFSPTQKKPSYDKAIRNFNDFINDGFGEDGSFNLKDYFPIAGVNSRNCKFCPFSENESVCPKSKRICA